MTAIPSEDARGVVAIDVEIEHATDVLRLYARDVRILRAGVRAGDRQVEARAAVVPPDGVALVLPDAIRGRATIELEFIARVNRDAKGIFTRTNAGDTYLYTQFEPVWARRAVPCFDEPGFKTPWTLTLRIRATDEAVSNTPIQSERREGDVRVVTFAETPPLPSYLIAFAVGPFEWLDAGRTRSGVPVRVGVPRGLAAKAKRLAERVQPLLAEIEDYLAIPYPFAKLDLVGVPDWNGGMENAALITLDTAILDNDPPELDFVVTHELVHQWFGDLVTAAWWDDIWLHEGIATWLSQVLTGRRYPDERIIVERDSFELDPDGVATIHFNDDDVTFRSAYGQGARLLRMLEAWKGPNSLRGPLRRMLDKHAGGSVTRHDLTAELDADARPVLLGLLASPPPTLEMALRCRPQEPAVLEITKRGDAPVPVCVRHGTATSDAETCALVAAASARVGLGEGCPSWIAPNRDGDGMYVVVGRDGALPRLLGDAGKLRSSERVRLLWDLLVETLQSSHATLGETLPVVAELVTKGTTFGDDLLAATWVMWSDAQIPDDLRASWRVFLRRTLGPTLRRISWSPPCKECPDVARIFAEATEDPALVADAKAHWGASLRQPMMPEERYASLAVRDGDAATFDHLAVLALTSSVGAEGLGVALGSFRDPALAARALELVARPGTPTAVRYGILKGIASVPESRHLAREFLLARPSVLSASIQFLAVGTLFGTICDRSELGRVRSLLSRRQQRALIGATQRSAKCAAMRAFHEPSLRAFLSTIPP